MKSKELKELVLQALETELGGVEIYKAAIKCAVNDDLRDEWKKYLDQTEEHVDIVRDLCDRLNVNTEEETGGRRIVRRIGHTLVESIKAAQAEGEDAAQIVAAECIVLAETKDHLNWELIGELAKHSKDEDRKALKEAHERVEEQEDEHLYHTTGWCRELWIAALGMKAVLPPPEEEKDVKTAIGAARAKAAREGMK